MIYSIPYLLYFFLLLLLFKVNKSLYFKPVLSVKERKRKRNGEIFAFFSFLIFYGLRGYIYTDCFQYVECFEEIDYYITTITEINPRFEPGYIICNYIVSRFTDSFFVFQFLWTLIDILLISSILKRECPQYYLLAFALLIPFWTGTQINLFRNIKSILVFFWAIKFIREQNIMKYMLTMFFAFFIHSTTLFFVPMYWLLRLDSKRIWMIVCMVSVGFYFLGLTGLFDQINALSKLFTARFADKAVSYTESAEDAGLSFGFLFRLILMIIFCLKYNNFSKRNLLLLNAAIIYLCCNMAFNSVVVFRDRFASLFVLGVIIMIPYVLEELKRTKQGVLMANILMLFITAYLYVQTNNVVATYENVITGVTDIDVVYNRNSNALIK